MTNHAHGNMPRRARRFLTADLPWDLDPLLSPRSGVLCLGFLLTEGEGSLLKPGRELLLPPAIWWVEFDTSGTATIHRAALGLLAKVPDGNRLANLAASYYESQLPGYTDWLDWKTPFKDVLQLAGQLEGIGLAIDPNEYMQFAEALIPIEIKAAWDFVLTEKLEVVVDYNPRERPVTLAAADSLGLSSVSSGVQYLRGAWDSVMQQFWDHPPLIRPKHPLGMMIVANSD